LGDGWDSRRSSYIIGDYGRIVSRRVSQSHNRNNNNQQMPNINAPLKLLQKNKTPVIKEEEEDDDNKSKRSKKTQKKHPGLRPLFTAADESSDNEHQTDTDNDTEKKIKITIRYRSLLLVIPMDICQRTCHWL